MVTRASAAHASIALSYTATVSRMRLLHYYFYIHDPVIGPLALSVSEPENRSSDDNRSEAHRAFSPTIRR